MKVKKPYKYIRRCPKCKRNWLLRKGEHIDCEIGKCPPKQER